MYHHTAPLSFRISYETACKSLEISRDTLARIIKTDPTFPKMMKDGNSRQARVYFDRKQLEDWYAAKLNKLEA